MDSDSLHEGDLGRSLVAGRDDAGTLDHQHYRAFRGSGAVHHPLRYNKALPRSERDGTVFKIDQKAALYDVEELILGIVLVPMIFPLHYAQPNHRVVHLAEGLVVP